MIRQKRLKCNSTTLNLITMKSYVRFLLEDSFVHLYPLIVSLVRLCALVTDLEDFHFHYP